MDSARQRNVAITQEFLNTLVFKKDYRIAKDLIDEDCIIHRNLGTGYGRDNAVSRVRDTSNALHPIHVVSSDSIITSHCILYDLKWKAKHVGTFQSIKATGNEIIYGIAVMIDLTGEKIERARVSTDIQGVMQQIGGTYRSKRDVVQITYNTSPIKELFNATTHRLEKHNIKLTLRQFVHLCLWTMGKSDSEVEQILSVSRRTAQYYQDKLKMVFNCYSKAQLIEKTQDIKLTHLLIEGFSCIMTAYTNNDNKYFIG